MSHKPRHNDKLKALVIVQGGATQFDGPFYRFLEQEGQLSVAVYYTNSAMAFHPYDPELSRESEWDHDVHSGYRFKVYPKSMLRRVQTSLTIVLNRPGLIILSGWRSADNLMILLTALLMRVPVGIRLDNTLKCNEGRTSRSRLRTFLLRSLLKLFATGHPVGTLASEYLQFNGFDSRRIFLFPYLVDSDLLTGLCRQSRVRRISMREEYGIEPGAFVFLGVMKFVEREDPRTLVEAFQELMADQSHKVAAHLILVGDGELRPQIEAWIHEKKVRNIHLPGYVAYTRLPGFFAISDVLIHTATRESWGVTVNEAIVCDLPVLAADTVGSGRDLIEEGVNGFTFPAGDSRALAECMRRILEEPGLSDSLKANCQTPARLEHFTYSATQKALGSAIAFVSAHNGASQA